MHPSQAGAFRKTVIVLLTIAFGGALLAYTAMANLDLLKSIYPDPKFYMFGLIALEGGVVYWTGYYMLHPSGVHKGLALVSLVVDCILSGTGFFYEMEQVTASRGTLQLPPIIIVIAFAVVFNVGMSILSHLLPSGMDFSDIQIPNPFKKKEGPVSRTEVQVQQTGALPSPEELERFHEWERQRNSGPLV